MPQTRRLPEPQESQDDREASMWMRHLHKAIAVFTERGYQQSSISELATATDLTAGSIYKAFGDKCGMFLAAIVWLQTLARCQARRRNCKCATGRGRVRAMLDYYAENSHGESGRRKAACIIGAAVELALFDDEAASKVSAHQQRTLSSRRRPPRRGARPMAPSVSISILTSRHAPCSTSCRATHCRQNRTGPRRRYGRCRHCHENSGTDSFFLPRRPRDQRYYRRRFGANSFHVCRHCPFSWQRPAD